MTEIKQIIMFSSSLFQNLFGKTAEYNGWYSNIKNSCAFLFIFQSAVCVKNALRLITVVPTMQILSWVNLPQTISLSHYIDSVLSFQ